jgi:hypothetical protein
MKKSWATNQPVVELEILIVCYILLVSLFKTGGDFCHQGCLILQLSIA